MKYFAVITLITVVICGSDKENQNLILKSNSDLLDGPNNQYNKMDLDNNYF
jgi:hypothetical protein